MEGENLVVSHETTGLDHPSEGSLHDPAFGQDLETFDVVASLHDLEPHLEMTNDRGDLSHKLSGVSPICPYHSQPSKSVLEFFKEEKAGAIPVLNISGGDLEQQDEAQGIYQSVSFSSCNFLTRIITTNSGVASCANALAVKNRSGRGFFLPALSRARSRR